MEWGKGVTEEGSGQRDSGMETREEQRNSRNMKKEGRWKRERRNSR